MGGLELETLEVVTVKMGADKHHLYSVDCCVDHIVPRFEIKLGFRALVKLGYRFSVCRLECRQRRKALEPRQQRQSEVVPNRERKR